MHAESSTLMGDTAMLLFQKKSARAILDSIEFSAVQFELLFLAFCFNEVNVTIYSIYFAC